MKSISHNLTKTLFLASLFLILSTTIASAQDTFPDDVNDEPAVPIDGFVISALIAGSILGIRKLRKSENA